MKGFFSHIGSKGNSGLPQFIYNKIPDHDFFIEGFAGSGVIGKNIYAGQSIFFIEKCSHVFEKLKSRVYGEMKAIHSEFIPAKPSMKKS